MLQRCICLIPQTKCIINCTKFALKNGHIAFRRKSTWLESHNRLMHVRPLVHRRSYYTTDHNFRKDDIESIKLKDPDKIFNFAQSLLSDIKPDAIPTASFLNVSKSVTDLLFQLRVLQSEYHMVQLFEDIVNKNLQLDSTYTIIMKYYGDKGDYDKVCEYYKKLNEDPITDVTARCYVPLICASIQSEKFDAAFQYLLQLNNLLKTHFQYHLYHEIITTCNQTVSTKNYEKISQIIQDILLFLETYGATYLTETVANALNDWFRSDSNKNNWKVTETSIGKNNGMCQFCKQNIGAAIIPPERRLQLKRNLMVLIKAYLSRKNQGKIRDLKIDKTNDKIKSKVGSHASYYDIYDAFSMTSSTAFSEVVPDESNDDFLASINNLMDDRNFEILKGLEHLLNNSKPFDIVVDVLNLGYFIHGFDPIHIRNVMKYFIDQDKNILILCAGLLKKELLEPDVEVPPSRLRIQALLKYLNEHCQLYFVESSIVDDYYILYTLIHHDFDINLLSRDRFKDHLFHFNAQNVADFKMWQQKNQFMFKTFDKEGKPVFKSRPVYRTAVHSHKNGWHIPISNTRWLCVLENKNKIEIAI